jgi:outer membrane receptor protein involved in Fe transport
MENQESDIFIDGIGLSGYRSFGDKVQRIGPFGKINLFIGNPDLNPSFTDALDFGYMNKFKKVTLITSAYYNKTKNP